MNQSFLFEELGKSDLLRKARETLRKRASCLHVYNLSGAQKAHFAAALARKMGKPLLVLTDNEKSATKAQDDYAALLGKPAALFPSREMTFYQEVAASREASFRRIEALGMTLSGEAAAVVAPVDALLHRLPPRSVFLAACIRVEAGLILPPAELLRKLQQAGYSREYQVEGRGQFSARGEIVDIYPSNLSHAVRIVYFDDEIESIRQLDVLSQRSQDELPSVHILPANEAPLPDETDKEAAAERIREQLAFLSEDTDDGGARSGAMLDLPSDEEKNEPAHEIRLNAKRGDRFRESMEETASLAESGVSVRRMEQILPLLYEKTESVFDYLADALVVLDEPDALSQRMENRLESFENAYASANSRGEALPCQETLLLSEEAFMGMLKDECAVCLTSDERTLADYSPSVSIDAGGMPIGSFAGRTKDLCEDVRRRKESGWRVIILSGGNARGERMRQSFEEEGIDTFFDETGDRLAEAGECGIYPTAISSGFAYPSLHLAVIVESDVYGAKNAGRKRRSGKGKLSAFTDLAVGDYVVHENYGIGVYEGIKRLVTDGASRDYLMVRYFGTDVLYIPVDHFDRIQKYIGSGESAPPKLSHLGGKDWEKQKKKARESLQALAFDLVRLYADRQNDRGFAFSKDTPWQMEFEESFPYEETPDQIRAIEEIKQDMESERPMDRLLCGDVGYGKTEVALRAAFKAVMSGKQVAILAPTTVLVQQHYQTLLYRLEGFPVECEVLSRFRTAKEQKETLKRLSEGRIDIIVGTHRLLAKDVVFHNLGLLIVDEEQRFGVGHKETIKNLKHSVDVLTLSATPIPRTLHMSMIGVRDMSLLETPPQARHPVQTYVMEYRDGIVRDAILREIRRGGQVFFLYNRVDSIERCYAALTQLIPEARIGIAHGQMRENALEDIMFDFSRHKFDVLLCTTIIESGLDIPNANTLIIYDADRFGLGQLYQLRGRVGRSNRVAYAYFTFRPGKVLSEQAQQRLDTIREFTEFGSGFRIAMRDLELRGAGNIFGPQQSGHLADVGYDLYCKMLDEAVAEAKGETKPANRELETRMDVLVDAYLPATYVEGEKQRLDVYKRIASIATASQRDDTEEELVDRFGEEPVCVANLIAVAYLKAICNRFGVGRVLQKRGAMEMRFAKEAKLDGAKLFSCITGLDKRLSLRMDALPTLVFNDTRKQPVALLNETVRVMERLQDRMGLTPEEKDGA
ncbi:MAG: transcription-repair coupling factor [Clostridiales bacterium]|nr:transcription-repair coupling factor [Clostridiales bacterium]